MGVRRLAPDLARGVGYRPGPLRLVTHGELSALVSDVSADDEAESEGRALRRDLRAHENVVRQAMEHGTILPVSFGSVFDSDRQLVEELLEPGASELTAMLRRFDGLVEVTLKVDFIEQAIMARLLERDPELRAWRDSARFGGSDEQVAFGQALAETIEDEAVVYAERLVSQLQDQAEDVRVADPGRGTAVLKASALVDRRRLAELDQTVAELAKSTGALLQFDYVGPLPPYSFVNLTLRSPAF